MEADATAGTQDDVRRQKQAASTYAFFLDTPVFLSPFEQRRLRLLNALFLAVARCGGKTEMRGPEAREIIIVIHQTSVAVSLDRLLKGRGKDASKGNGSPDELRFAILVGYDHEQERAAWQDVKRVALRASFRRDCRRGRHLSRDQLPRKLCQLV
jgi:hypothetical protein